MKLEVSIARARANVMLYEETSKKWISASYNANSLCNVDILHHYQELTFRVVAMTMASNEVVLNSSLRPGMRYNEATANFHQWRDGVSKQVFGLHFNSYEEAAMFGSVVSQSLEVLSSGPSQVRLPWPHPEVRQQSTSPGMYSDQAEDIYEECQPEGRVDSAREEEEEEDLYQEELRSAARPVMEFSQNFQRMGSCRASLRSVVPPSLPPLNSTLNSSLNSSQNSFQNSSLNSSQNYSQNQSQNYSQNQSQNHSQNHSQNYSQNQSQNYSQNQSQNYSQNQSQNYSQNQSQNYSQNQSQNHSQNQSQNYSQKNNQQLSSFQDPYSMARTHSQPAYQGDLSFKTDPIYQGGGDDLPRRDTPPGEEAETRYIPGESLQPSGPQGSITTQSAPPPPPPPPPPPAPPIPAGSPSQPGGLKVKTLTGDLQSIRLKESEQSPTERKAGGMFSMMEEMKSKLAKRKQNSESNLTSSPCKSESLSTPTKCPTKSTETFSPKLTPTTLKKLDNLTGPEMLKSASTIGKNNLEALKKEILDEIRSEIEKSKIEIIGIIREEIKSLKM